MSRSNFWSRSLSRVEIDQHAREERLRLERVERLLVPCAAARQPRLRRLLSLRYGRKPRVSGIGGPQSDLRPSCMSSLVERRRLEKALSRTLIARLGV